MQQLPPSSRINAFLSNVVPINDKLQPCIACAVSCTPGGSAEHNCCAAAAAGVAAAFVCQGLKGSRNLPGGLHKAEVEV